MTIKTHSGLRRVLSVAAFTTLIAAVTMAFAEAPQSRKSVTITRAAPALSTTPTPAIRLAEAPSPKRKAATVAASNKVAKSSKSPKAPLSGTLNINTAKAEELTKLPGVGPKKASLIVQWRQQHGSFGRVVDLRRVKGFGAKSVKKLLPYLAISGKHTLQ
jgi:competence protein ComEA